MANRSQVPRCVKKDLSKTQEQGAGKQNPMKFSQAREPRPDTGKKLTKYPSDSSGWKVRIRQRSKI